MKQIKLKVEKCKDCSGLKIKENSFGTKYVFESYNCKFWDTIGLYKPDLDIDIYNQKPCNLKNIILEIED